MYREMEPATEYQGADLEALANLHRYQRWVIEIFLPYLSGRVIEFGAGVGNISTLIRPHVATLDLVEPSANLVISLKRRFGDTDCVAIYEESLESRLLETADETYESIVLVNVLEHIEDDAMALEGFYRILKPGGHLLLFVPALEFLFSDLDVVLRHFRRYQRPELNRRTTGAGFDIVKSRYFDVLGVFPWWLLNTKMGATEFNPVLASIYDAVFVPLSRGLESLAPPPFGKNIILVARRPEGPKK
ncbi:MAG: class I SAM-dependent methyltransferase [Rhodospirillales bacterium]|jgi:SAM-dependent methyltransferase|nr:class I SAM-dependent methyltransferase [Rhodospirillales bacterium]